MDLNHCEEYCVLLPNHSAIRPFLLICFTKLEKYWVRVMVQFFENWMVQNLIVNACKNS